MGPERETRVFGTPQRKAADGGGPSMDFFLFLWTVLAFEALNARRMLGLFKKDSKVEAFKFASILAHRHRSGVDRPRLTPCAQRGPRGRSGSASGQRGRGRNLHVRVGENRMRFVRPEISDYIQL